VRVMMRTSMCATECGSGAQVLQRKVSRRETARRHARSICIALLTRSSKAPDNFELLSHEDSSTQSQKIPNPNPQPRRRRRPYV